MYPKPSTLLLATLATLLATTSSLHLPASFARRNIEPRVPSTTAFIYASPPPPAASSPPKPLVKTLTRLTTRYISAPLPTKRPVRVTTITLPLPRPAPTKRPSPPKPKPRPTRKPAAASPPPNRPRPAAPMISNYAPFANGRTIPPISAPPLPTRRPGLPAVHHPPPRPAGNGLPDVHHPPRPVAPKPKPSPRPTSRPASPRPKPSPSKPVGIIITPLTQTVIGGKTTYIPIPTAKPAPKPKEKKIDGGRLVDLIGQVGKLPKPKETLMTDPGPTPVPNYPGLPKAKEGKDKEAKARALLEGLRGMQNGRA